MSIANYMIKNNLALAFFILLKFALQYFAIDEVYELHRDEFLHLDLGKHLDAGYTTVPPVTGLISYFIYLLGNSVFYAIGLYPVLFAFGARYLEHLLEKGWLRYLRPLMLVIPVMVMIPAYQLILPVLSPEAIIEKKDQFLKLGLLKWEDGVDHQLPQDFADMLGWRELAALVDSALELVPDLEQTIIHCDNYGQAGAINYYSRQNHIEALTLHADYINWYSLDEIIINHVILVQSANDDDPDRKRERQLFDEVSFMGEIGNPFAREYGTKVYLLKGAKQNINQILVAEIERRKSPPLAYNAPG